MTVLTDADLYLRGIQTLLACWEECARGSTGAVVRRLPGVSVAVFPDGPERGFLNNAVLGQNLAPAARASAVEAMEAAYGAAGVGRFAAWVHERDQAMCGELERRGYTLEESTLAMGMALEDVRLPPPQLDLGPPDWFEYLRILGVPPDFLDHADRAAFHILLARLNGENAATASIPAWWQARTMRSAISPRLATSTLRRLTPRPPRRPAPSRPRRRPRSGSG